MVSADAHLWLLHVPSMASNSNSASSLPRKSIINVKFDPDHSRSSSIRGLDIASVEHSEAGE